MDLGTVGDFLDEAQRADPSTVERRLHGSPPLKKWPKERAKDRTSVAGSYRRGTGPVRYVFGRTGLDRVPMRSEINLTRS